MRNGAWQHSRRALFRSRVSSCIHRLASPGSADRKGRTVVSHRIAVVGAGAVGCFYGGMLARAGRDVVLIGRPLHVEAIEREGLRLQTKTFDERLPVAASTELSAVRGAGLVLFCVKSTDTEET